MLPVKDLGISSPSSGCGANPSRLNAYEEDSVAPSPSFAGTLTLCMLFLGNSELIGILVADPLQRFPQFHGRSQKRVR